MANVIVNFRRPMGRTERDTELDFAGDASNV